MVQTLRRPWQEAASSAFAVASALPVTMNSTQIAELFEQVEHGTTELRCALTAEISALRNANGESLLTVAVRSGNTAVAKQLAQLDPDAIDETDNEGWSALLNAAHCGHVDIVRLLIDNGASVDQPDLMGWSPLMWAVYKNHLDVVDLLVNAKAHVNLIDEEDGLTPLIVASGRGFSQIVERLIDSDCQVNACDKFGSTALIWAARKGHLPVVQLLLNSGAEVDAVGMYSSTALMLATRGNFIQVVELLLTREPNVNVADQNGLTALGMAARDGYADICESLINSGAFVNQCDRFGNWILTSAVRSGNAAIVRMILDKFADINCQDSEKRTPLHLAIDKSFNDIAYILLEKKPNLELKNKDGETPLLRAAKCRHVHLCTYLMSFGAKLAAVDNCGDNALHLALRARSRRLTQALLSNPSDSRLLYRPNKLGQTPYSIDLSNPQPILPLIFGPIDAEDKMDTAMGYDVYSNVLADIVCEPSLSLPLTIGLYAKWGSGKSALLAKLKEAMHSFSRDWLDGVSLSVSFALFFAIFLFFGMFSLTFTMLIAISNSVTAYLISWSVFLLIFIIFCSLIVVVYYGDRKNWYTSMDIANFFARVFSRIRLVYNILTLHAPMNSEDSASMPVSFLFADYHRLSSIGGEQALAKIVATLFEAAETHFGVLPVRLFCCMKPPYPGIHGSLRRHCGVPHVILLIVAVFLLIMAQVFGTVWLLSDRDPNNFNLFIAIAFLCGFVMIAIYPLALIIMYSWTNVPRRRVNAAARNAHKLRFEGLMQKLQTEVDLLADMIRSLDAFTRSHTRLVVVVDGLDNCEQERMVQTLDALELLFSARKHRPFITIIAVDPHVIVSAINHNMHSALSGTELTGHDYLKNIISMPFYLHNSALRQLQSKLREKRESMAEWKERFKRQDTFYGSHLSLREADGRTSRKSFQKSTVPNMNSNSVVGRNMNDGILGEDYFSNMNPRAMRRIVNALTLTGRLMRAFEIDFSWMSLGHWVSLLEQWPSRMCWLIDRALEVHNNQLLLSEVYYQLKDHIPAQDDLMQLDRNLENFEGFLDSKGIPSAERLTVGHVKKFVPCTSSLDPYLRKLIRERSKGLVDIEAQVGSAGMAIPPNARLLFSDDLTWMSIDTPLVEMKLDAVVNLIRKIDIPSNRLDSILDRFYQLNLCGLVLATCPLPELKDSMQLPLGDWTLIRLLLETLKVFGSSPPGLRVDKRKALTLREEDEEEEIEEAAEAALNSEKERAPLLGSVRAEQRRRSTIVQNATELSIDHKCLMEKLSGMDLTETEGDVNEMHFSHFSSSTDGPSPMADGFLPASVSAAPSVRFDDNINDLEREASDADSTQSRYDSKENLLEDERSASPPAHVDLMRFDSGNTSSDFVRSSYRTSSRYRRMSRGDLMRGMHQNDTIRSSMDQSGTGAAPSSSSLMASDEDLNQQTVQRRGGDDFERIQLEQLFNRQSDA
ncbi:KAP NTPase domain-containing protein [Caenorhabditis elegans]|uniref:KAP NTPase domain-containing protein n=1 Tax=Caenorhabditis elegans TaxID=6239 RepID=A0A061AJK4_CAEEL|nr:KAP NTPase domain-containing protein [Caenorhabditis elegans]CDR32811.1 KAP NTPase domain-containing protein [Caenorhabditis elegans]|eukprot:NP_001294017.1 KiDINs220 (vertebrate scaffold protein) homolog [Caenorhabditis elegans]